MTEQRAREKAEKMAEREAFLKQGMKDSMESLTHELRSPLQGIMGMASCLLENEATAEEARESLSIIMASSRHLLVLINNMLDVRKCDANMMDEFPLSPIPLGSSMSDATSFCRPMAAVTNIRLELTLDPSSDQVLVQSNTVRLQQVLINLVSNSIKYAPARSEVRLTTRITTFPLACREMMAALALGLSLEECRNNLQETDLVAIITVRDSGPGISEELAGKIFRKFAQATNHNHSSIIGGNTVAQPSGTGLGLNLCLKFVQRMHGNIWVTQSSDGTCFSFFIPLATGGVTDLPLSRVPSLCELNASDCRTMAQHLHSYRVLVVDDTIINLKILERMLLGLGIGKVVTCNSGRGALSHLVRADFDLVITDIQMPEMDGLELAATIRDHNRILIKPYVVGLTAATIDTMPERCLESGISRVLYKPITARQLQQFLCDISPPRTRSSDL